MDPQRWQRLEQIYYAALPLDVADRAEYLGTCAADVTLKAQVESLLEADASSGEFLKTALFDFGLRLMASDEQMASQQSTPSSIAGLTLDGRYKIERELGAGGVGVVYFARDQKLHNKPVVIKVLLQRSQEHKWILQKFYQEKEALARVDHPGVVGIVELCRLWRWD